MIIVICNDVETHRNASLRQGEEYKNTFGPQKNNLGSIVRGLKGTIKNKICTFYQGESSFSWQSNYHERIIRNEEELQKIRQYIYDNPANWQKDEENISSPS